VVERFDDEHPRQLGIHAQRLDVVLDASVGAVDAARSLRSVTRASSSPSTRSRPRSTAASVSCSLPASARSAARTIVSITVASPSNGAVAAHWPAGARPVFSASAAASPPTITLHASGSDRHRLAE
jgi:hypothetical protein